jgi:hypothetical protein
MTTVDEWQVSVCDKLWGTNDGFIQICTCIGQKFVLIELF